MCGVSLLKSSWDIYGFSKRSTPHMSNDNVVSLATPAGGWDPLTELLRTGARRLIEAAVSAEFEEYRSAFGPEKLPDGRQRVVRNGHLPERQILTGLGEVEVRVPKARSRSGSPAPFRSSVVPPHPPTAALHRGGAGQAAGGARHRAAVDLCRDRRRAEGSTNPPCGQYPGTFISPGGDCGMRKSVYAGGDSGHPRGCFDTVMGAVRTRRTARSRWAGTDAQRRPGVR